MPGILSILEAFEVYKGMGLGNMSALKPHYIKGFTSQGFLCSWETLNSVPSSF